MNMDFNRFSFSTSWNWRNGNNGRKLMEEIKSLGFHQVELNYKISEEMLETIVPMVEGGEIRISSVHNVFPDAKDPDYDTDSLLLGYEDPEKRKKSVALTKRSVDYAAALGAKVVVIHPGEVPVPEERQYDILLKKLYKEGKKSTEEYGELFEEMMRYRKAKSPVFLERIKESLEEVAEYILKKNYSVVLGIENRAMCHQIPEFTETTFLLEGLKGLPIYLWYDTGHGMMMSNLGMFDHQQEVYKIKDKIIGMHIHDAVGVEDHWSPYIKSGNLDAYLELIKDVPLRVLELGAKNTVEDIIKGAGILEDKIRSAISGNDGENRGSKE